VSAEDDSGRRLLSESWPLERTAEAYRRFMKSFEPLRAWVARDKLSDIEALTARVLLIHQYRRVVLRDPLLPAALLPRDWPGRAARQLCGEIYRGVLPASEQWLDRHASNENGALPAAGKELSRRFVDQ
jgi:phenylacetic acid degradation operon negative regulatory protein